MSTTTGMDKITTTIKERGLNPITDMDQIVETIKKIMHDTRYVVFIDVFHSNPNGDPKNEGMPRMDDDFYGIISDVCLKRGIRENILVLKGDVPGYAIFVQEERPLMVAVEQAFANNSDVVKHFADVRMFGGVIPSDNDDVSDDSNSEDGEPVKKSSKKGGKKNRKMTKIVGPVVVAEGRSIDPITVDSKTINRCCTTREGEGGNHNQGEKHQVNYARYRCEVFVSRRRAEQNGMTTDDLKLLEEAMNDIYLNRRASARPDIRTTAIYKIECRGEDNADALNDAMDSVQCVGPENHIAKSNKDYQLPDAADLSNDLVKVERIK